MRQSQPIDRENPGCMLFLIDQSASMSDPFAGEPGRSKAERLADAINTLLHNLVIKCTKDPSGEPWNYFDIGVIGYGDGVGPALGGSLAGQSLVPLSDLYHNSRIQERSRKVDDGTGGLTTQTVKVPVWLDPIADNGTPMAEAMAYAYTILDDWVQRHSTSFPPLVVNITDGEANPDTNPLGEAERLKQLATSGGNLLLFNLHLSSRPGAEILYPEHNESLPDAFARQLFEMSSVLPDYVQLEARREGYAVGPQSRGFVFNADLVAIIQFLDIGTRLDLR